MSTIALKIESFLKRTNSFSRFLLVGVVNTLTGLSLMFLCLNVMEWSYWVATFIGNSVGALVSYLLNRTFTFQSTIPFKKGLPWFITVILTCFLFSYWLSEFVAEFILNDIQTLIKKDELAILIGSGLYTVSNYFGQKYLVFRK